MRREKISKTKDVLDVEHQVMIGWVWMISYNCSEKIYKHLYNTQDERADALR